MPADVRNDVLLVTCANGKQSSHLLPFLLPRWKHLRLAVKSESSRQKLLGQFGPTWQSNMVSDTEVVAVDLAQSEDCMRICEGVTAVYHIGPAFHPRETEIGYNIIDAANTHGVKHLVYSSVLHPSLRKLMNHDCKRYIEEHLIESGLPYTILQPSQFMDTFPIQTLISEEKPIFTSPCNPDVKFSHTSLHDLGEAAANILEQRENHFHATYQLVSTSPPMSYRDVCEIASGVIGRDILLRTTPFQETLQGTMEGVLGLPEHAYTRDGVQRMLLYYESKGLVGNANVMRWVLGREPSNWEEWIWGKMGMPGGAGGGKVGGLYSCWR